MLSMHPATEEEKRRISLWRYGGEYAVYNLPPYAEQLKSGRGFANPKNRFYTFHDGARLIGYASLAEEENRVLLGAGVHPDLCGRGFGQEICRAARRLSHSLFPGKPLCLHVRCWNTRAVRCYEKAGFVIAGEAFTLMAPGGEDRFFRMTEA